ncbi:MAG TPA: hypothetical protein VK817_18735 [Trebonia sp.]|jgi:succinate dehydrogenase hydrophobic anchor subunit|nr:hypothetical protein [Trebonia sp.]
MSRTERRTVYGRAGTATPLWMWIVQRLSGLLLGPLVFIHVLVANAPFMVWLTALLLAVILAHGFIGLWRLAAMRRLTMAVSRYAVIASIAVVAVIAVFGIALLCSIP